MSSSRIPWSERHDAAFGNEGGACISTEGLGCMKCLLENNQVPLVQLTCDGEDSQEAQSQLMDRGIEESTGLRKTTFSQTTVLFSAETLVF